MSGVKVALRVGSFSAAVTSLFSLASVKFQIADLSSFQTSENGIFTSFFFGGGGAVILDRTLYHRYRGISQREELDCLAFLRLDILANFPGEHRGYRQRATKIALPRGPIHFNKKYNPYSSAQQIDVATTRKGWASVKVIAIFRVLCA